MVIVGNKLDRQNTERAVSIEEGTSLAEEFMASHLEISVCPFTPSTHFSPSTLGQREFQSEGSIRNLNSKDFIREPLSWERPRLWWGVWCRSRRA